MAIRTFNSVGGFSVGEIPVNIISNVGEITGPGNANITGTVYACTALRTDSLLHLDGSPWDFQQPAGGADGQIQYYLNGDFGASSNFSYTSSNSYFYVNGNANITGNTTTNNATVTNLVNAGNVQVGSLTSGRVILAGASGKLVDSSSLTFGSGNLGVTGNAVISGDVSASNVFSSTLTSGRITFAGTDGKLVDSSSLTFGLGNLGVTGNAIISGYANITGNAKVSSELIVGGNANVTGNLTVLGDSGITGNLSITSNITALNVTDSSLTAGRITFAGTGGKLTDSTGLTFDSTSGNLSVSNNVSAANVVVSGLTAGRVTFAGASGKLVDSSGLTFSAGDLTVSGNVSAANVLVSTLTSGRITLAGTAGELVDSSGLTYSSGNLGVTGNATFTGNTSAANMTITSLTSGRVLIAGTGGQLVDNSGLTYSSSNLGVTGNITATGNLSANNGSFSNNITVTGNANVTGNISGNNASLLGNLDVAGNIVANNITSNGAIHGTDFYGTFHGSISGDITAPGGAGANTYVVFNDNGLMNAQPGFAFNKSTNAISISGNLSAANISTGLVTGTLTVASNAQPNITSVGTLLGVDVTGNANVSNTVNTGNLKVTAKVISSLVPSTDVTYDLGSASAQWKNVYVATNVLIGGTTGYIGATGNVINMDAANIANNVSTQTLTVRGAATLQDDLTVSGNLTVSGSTTYVNVTNTSIKDPLIDLGGSGSGANATSYDGKDRGLVLKNYKSDGSAVSNQAFIWKTGNTEFQAIGNVTGIADEVVSGTLGNIRANVMIANLSGQVLTASQTNITTVGTLTDLNVAGNIITMNANVTGTFVASGLTYPGTDGTAGQVLETYGNGVLHWTTIDTWRIQNASSNVSVVSSGNVMTYIGGTEKVRVSTGGVDITGNLAVTANTSLKQTKVTNLDLVSFYPNGVASSVVTAIKSATVTTTSIAKQTIASVAASDYRGVEFFVKGEDTDGTKYTVATVSAVHNGSSVDYAIYGTVNLPSSDTTGALSVSLSGGYITLETTPASSNTTVWTTQYRTI